LSAAGFAVLAALTTAAVGPDAARPATGAPLSNTVTIPQAVDRTCFDENVGNVAGAATYDFTPEFGDASFITLEARLTGPAAGDWDLAVFDQAGNAVAAAASSGPDEVASGYLLDPGPLTVQACRISGVGTVGQLSVETVPIAHSQVEKASLAFVKTPRRTDVETLQQLGLDLTEHGGEGYVAVILHGPEDKLALDKAGLDYEVQVPNLARQSARQREADAEYAADTQRSALPSGRDGYRRLADYQQELKDLAKDYPEIVRPIELKHETYEGRTVEGIEITTDVDNVRDGKPVFLQMGVHHAREWPSGEHAMEWAYQLVKGYSNGNDRVVNLVKKVRTIVIPIVNPDGFNTSREAGQQQGGASGRDGNDTVNLAMHPNEYRRKNCRFADDSDGGSCVQPSAGLAEPGVDPNRNYGAFWGGPGSGTEFDAQDYHGPGPFSEPETQNIRELVSSRPVTMLITNHTFSDLVLRAPGLASEPDPVDEVQMKALGDAMAAQNGYQSLHGFELYDTTGTTEDWSYNTTGGFGYTFEIGCNDEDASDGSLYNCNGNFHPTFQHVVDEWKGNTPQATPLSGKGNQEAYFIAEEAAADPKLHSILEGQAPPGAELKVEKSFETPTFDSGTFEDNLDWEMKVPDSGNYDFHITPSTRPLVAQDRGRIPQGPPSPEIDLCSAGHGADSCAPGASAHPCGDAATTDETCFNEHSFDITNGPNEDNDRATVALSWVTPTTDWDLFVYRDGNDDGDSQDPEDKLVGTSASGPTSDESTTFVRPQEGLGDTRLLPGPYVARVVNFAAAEPYDATVTFGGPEPPTKARTEVWHFSCSYAGEKRITKDILIARGERQNLDLSACGLPTKGGAGRCAGAKGTIVGTKGDDKMIGTNGRDVIIGLGGEDKIKGRGGNDLICAKGGNDRVVGGKGDDTIGAGGGRDRAYGGAGNDKLKGGARTDRLAGGGGNDRLIGGGGRDNLNGGGGRDHCSGRRDRARNC
jgi:hypothetical protein